MGHFSIGYLPDVILWVQRDGEERKKRENFGLRLRMQDLMVPSLFMMLRWMRRSLGNWVREKSIAAGTEIFEEERVERFTARWGNRILKIW